MKSPKLCVFVLFVVALSSLLIVSNGFGEAGQSTGIVDIDRADLLAFGVETTTFQPIDEMGPALWWTVFAVLLLDIGCVIGYLYYQRRLKWRQTYWRLMMGGNQNVLDLIAGQPYTRTITVQRYQIQEQPNAGGFYLALKPKKAPAPCGPALFL